MASNFINSYSSYAAASGRETDLALCCGRQWESPPVVLFQPCKYSCLRPCRQPLPDTKEMLQEQQQHEQEWMRLYHGYRRSGSKQIHRREYGCLQGVQGLMHSQTKYACIFYSYLYPFSRDCPASNKTGAADSLLRPAPLCAVLNSSISSNNRHNESQRKRL